MDSGEELEGERESATGEENLKTKREKERKIKDGRKRVDGEGE